MIAIATLSSERRKGDVAVSKKQMRIKKPLAPLRETKGARFI